MDQTCKSCGHFSTHPGRDGGRCGFKLPPFVNARLNVVMESDSCAFWEPRPAQQSAQPRRGDGRP